MLGRMRDRGKYMTGAMLLLMCHTTDAFASSAVQRIVREGASQASMQTRHGRLRKRSATGRVARTRWSMQRQQLDEDEQFEPFAYEGPGKNPVKKDPAGYLAAVAVQSLPLLGFSDRWSHWTFFLGLATSSVYLGSRAPPLVPPEAKPLSMRQALLAPFFGAATLGSLYYCITVLHLDPSFAYRVATTAFAGGVCISRRLHEPWALPADCFRIQVDPVRDAQQHLQPASSSATRSSPSHRTWIQKLPSKPLERSLRRRQERTSSVEVASLFAIWIKSQRRRE